MRNDHAAAARRRRRRRPAAALLVLAAFATFAVAATAARQAALGGSGYKAAGGWGKAGIATGQFASNGGGLAVDKAGSVYVADSDNNRIQVFSAKGSFQRKWGSTGSDDGQFTSAGDVAIAPDGSIWVADDGGGRYEHFSKTGAFQSAVPVPSELARGVAVDANGTVLAAVEGSAKAGFRLIDSAGTLGALLGGQSEVRADDVEASPDGTIWLIRQKTQGSGDWLERYSTSGRLLKKIPLGAGDGNRGLAVDLDCNLIVSDYNHGGLAKLSPSGKKLASIGLPTQSRDMAVGPTGDVYVLLQNAGIARFTEDRTKPAAAVVGKRVTVVGGVAKVRYTLAGVACPAQIPAVASLSGGVTGKASVQVAAGKTTTIEIPVKGSGGAAQLKIVLKTNGRPTTQVASVTAG